MPLHGKGAGWIDRSIAWARREEKGGKPRIEAMQLESTVEAAARMRSGQARFRMVLTMTGERHAHQ